MIMKDPRTSKFSVKCKQQNLNRILCEEKSNNAKVFILRKMPPKSLSVRAIKEITESISLTSTKKTGSSFTFYLHICAASVFCRMKDIKCLKHNTIVAVNMDAKNVAKLLLLIAFVM